MNRTFLAASAIALASGAAGIAIGKYGLIGRLLHRGAQQQSAEVLSLVNQPNPVEVRCPTGAKVWIVAGQSNAGNHGEGAFTPPSRVVNFYDGHCYRAKDPLLGATGNEGSVWSRLAARAQGPIILAPAAVTRSQMKQWAPGGVLHANLTETIKGLAAAGLKPSAVLWQQGEGDFYTPEPEYERDMESLIASVRALTPAPFYAALSTRCIRPPSESIRRAIRKAVANTGGHIGPDTDVLGDDLRRDGCHFNAKGLDAAASLWWKSISAS